MATSRSTPKVRVPPAKPRLATAVHRTPVPSVPLDRYFDALFALAYRQEAASTTTLPRAA